MPILQKKYLTLEEAIAIDESTPLRLEYWNGRMYWQGEEVDLSLPLEEALHKMQGGTPRHALVGGSVGSEIRMVLDRHRRHLIHVYNSDLTVFAPDGSYVHPDVTVVCGAVVAPVAHPDGVANPVLLVEVPSRATEGFDRGAKFHRVMAIETLQHYVLVSDGVIAIDVFTRQSDGAWLFRSYGPGQSVPLPAIGIELSVDFIYQGVELDPVGPPAPPSQPASTPS